MFWEVTLDLLKGFGTTVEVFALTLLGALPLGLIICFGSMSRFAPLKWLLKTFIWIIRGTPLMLQLIVVFYGPGLMAAWAQKMPEPNFIISFIASWSVMDRFVAVIIAFVINYACYFSEIYRGGIEAIPKGQYEACQVLGMSKSQTFFRVVLMQVIKHIVPPMSNEIITLVKDTSLARTIAVYEIIWSAQSFAKSDGLLWPMFYTAAFYLIFNGLLTVVFGKIEKKLNYYHN
ncbi:MAG: amino acid ABC transporter permease [Acutalibacteraceae bacterium]